MPSVNNVASNGGKWITPKRRLAIYIRDGFQCVYCLRDLRGAKPGEMQLDHVHCQNGSKADHSSKNLVTSCRSCNSSKQDQPVSKFATPEARQRIRNWTRRSMARFLAQAAEIIRTKGA